MSNQITQTRVQRRSIRKANLLTAYERASGKDVDQPEAIDAALSEALEHRGIPLPAPDDESDETDEPQSAGGSSK
jgi:hypothetical protein